MLPRAHRTDESVSGLVKSNYVATQLLDRGKGTQTNTQTHTSYLHSISETNPAALSIAATLDKERCTSGARGPLHGIPFVVKDNVYTDDAHNTSEGGLVLLGGRYAREATLVAKMRAAGGVLLGHASLSEAADHRALTNFSDGYSTRAGQIRNPFNLTQGDVREQRGLGRRRAEQPGRGGRGDRDPTGRWSIPRRIWGCTR